MLESSHDKCWMDKGIALIEKWPTVHEVGIHMWIGGERLSLLSNGIMLLATLF